ncbi:hypothetical protein D020_2094A, partial [Vibrio parahaemolyticus SBR10290]
MVSPA